jgi:hypothetical protein
VVPFDRLMVTVESVPTTCTLVMMVSGVTKKPLPRDVGVWMLTTAGITRPIRSSRVAGVSATPGADAIGADRFCGTASGAVVVIDGGADAGGTASRPAEEVMEIDADAVGDGAGWRLFIHQTVPAVATAATASNTAV